MKKVVKGLSLIFIIFLLASSAYAKTASEVFDAVSSSVVVIITYDSGGKEKGLGSGVVLADGVIATNYHVIENASTIKILYRKTTYPAVVKQSD